MSSMNNDKNKSVNKDGQKSFSGKSAVKGDVAVWVVTLIILVAFALLVAWLCNMNEEKAYGTLFAEDSRYGSASVAELSLKNGYVAQGKQVIWYVDSKQAKLSFYGEKDALKLDTSALSVGSHVLQVSIDDEIVATKTVLINKPSLVVRVPDITVEYGEKIQKICATAEGWVDGDTAESAGFDDTVNFESGKNLDVGVYNLSHQGYFNDKYDVTMESGSLTVLPRRLTLAPCVFSKVYDGTESVKAEGLSVLGALEKDHVGVNAILKYCDKNAGNNKKVIIVDCVLTGVDSKNYFVDFSETEFFGSISPLTLTLLDVLPNDKVYDGTTSVTFLNGGKLNGVLPCDKVSIGFLNACFSDAKKGNDKIVFIKGVTLVGADSANYVVAPSVSYASIFGKKLNAVHGNN